MPTISISDLEKAYKKARRTYKNTDLNYQEWVRETPMSEFIADIEAYLEMNKHLGEEDVTKWSSWNVYVKAKAFVIARDEGFRAARLWVLQNGGEV